MAHGRVAGDPLGQLEASIEVPAFEEPLDALVDEPQARLHLQDGLADDREPEVPGFDQPGVDRAHRDLVDPRTLDLDERVGAGVVHHRRRGTGVVAHRVPALGPVLVEDEAPQERVADGNDAEEVVELAFEAAGREGESRQRGHLRAGAVDGRHAAPRAGRVVRR